MTLIDLTTNDMIHDEIITTIYDNNHGSKIIATIFDTVLNLS